ncbi:MAG: hypothetical protein M9913_16095 [Bryobacteraceae bacterium]|nr:hypothetical protein [Solibacteraceae bacterium]MCL4844645.1 hypothetical protein [Bryobacteraceae bacterium]MCO5352396.1 hypothetical protein [Bryobacteraceae bacterium]
MLLLSMAVAGLLSIGEPLPSLQGKDLSGTPIELPAAARGDVTLLIVGFSYDSRVAVEDWAKRFRQEFERLPGVRFYEVPMIGGMARMGKWFIDSGMRRGTPKADHGKVITVYGGSGDWKKRLGYRDGAAAYLILLDRTGRVRYLYQGKMDSAAWRKLASTTRQWMQQAR